MRPARLTRPLLIPIPILLAILAATLAGWPRAASSVQPPPPANQATPGVASCAAVDPSLVELGLGFERGPDPLTPGRAFSVSDGTLAVLIVVGDVDAAGAATAFDFQASIDVAAVVVHSATATEVFRFQPPALTGAALSAPDGAAITQAAFCYEATLTPAPPLPPEEAPRATVAARATGTAGARLTETAQAAAMATATAAVGEALATAAGAATTLAAQATREAALVATVTAAAAEHAAALATATALAGSARATADALGTAEAEREIEMSAGQTAVAAAQATAELIGTLRAGEALTATAFAAPTATPAPDPAAPAALYRGDAVAGFAGWSLAPGWAMVDGVLVSDGSAGGTWATSPFQVTDRPDYAVEIEARLVGEPGCEQNFGVAARGSDEGYYAAGVEWRCEPVAVLWAGQDPLADTSLDPGADWHVYRLEVRGDAIRLQVDGTLVLEATDDRYRDGGEVAIWSSGARVEVRSFVVTALPPRP